MWWWWWEQKNKKNKQGQITPFGGGCGSDNPLLKYMNMVKILVTIS